MIYNEKSQKKEKTHFRRVFSCLDFWVGFFWCQPKIKEFNLIGANPAKGEIWPIKYISAWILEAFSILSPGLLFPALEKPVTALTWDKIVLMLDVPYDQHCLNMFFAKLCSSPRCFCHYVLNLFIN